MIPSRRRISIVSVNIIIIIIIQTLSLLLSCCIIAFQTPQLYYATRIQQSYQNPVAWITVSKHQQQQQQLISPSSNNKNQNTRIISTTKQKRYRNSSSRHRITSTLLATVIPDQEHDQIRTATTSSSNQQKSSSSSTSSSYTSQQQQQQQQQQPYEKTIVRLGRLRKTDEALNVFYSIPYQPTIRQINAIIDACARAQPVRLDTAFTILNTYCISAVGSSLLSSSSSITTENENIIDKQLLVPKREKIIKKIPANVYTFGALMNAVSNTGDVQTAVTLVSQTMEVIYGVQPNAVVYNAAISTCAKSNPPRPDIAIKLLDQAQERNIPITVNGYNAACAAAAAAAKWELAASILQRMTTLSLNTTSSSSNGSNTMIVPQPDSVTYGTVMSACEKCNEWDQCLHYFDSMIKDAKLQPDRISLTSALHACQQLGLAQRALLYLDRMKQLHENSNDKEQQLINIQDNNKQEEKRSKSTQQRQRDRLRYDGPDAVAYRLAISACARGGQWKDAITVLQSYINDPYQVDPTKDVMAFTAAINGCENAGSWKQAFVLLDQMRQYGAIPNEVTYTAVIGACATACAKLQQQRASTFDTNIRTEIPSSEILEPQRKALQLLNVLRKDPTVPNPNIQVYNAAIRACAEGYDLQRAFQLHDLLLNDSIQPTIVTYGTLMTACERIGNVKGMDKVFLLLRQNNIQPNVVIYGAALSVCRKAGESERAYLLLQRMLKDGLTPNIATFNTALSAQTEYISSSSSSSKSTSITNIERAMLIYQLLQSRKYGGIGPNRQTYNLIIRALNNNKQPQEAESLLVQMKDDRFQPDVDLYTATVSAYERNGKPLLALNLMEQMRTDGYDFYEASVLNTLFKRAVKLATALGRTWTPPSSSTTTCTTVQQSNSTSSTSS